MVDELHRGDIAVVSADGELLHSVGEPRVRLAYWRSSAKPFQTMAVVASGATDRFGFSAEDIALTASSHSGERVHVERVSALLERIGCGVDDLQCGAHLPFDAESAHALLRSGEEPTALHSNCSGKHAGMLALALQLGVAPDGYRLPEHPVQQLMLDNVARFSGVPRDEIVVGTDGCGVPCFGTSMYDMAYAFARLMAPDESIPAPYPSAAAVVREAMMAHPYLVAGRDRLDTDLMRAAPGALVSKVGAGGVQCIGLRGGLGVAVKMESGGAGTSSAPPAGVAALDVLRQLRRARRGRPLGSRDAREPAGHHGRGRPGGRGTRDVRPLPGDTGLMRVAQTVTMPDTYAFEDCPLRNMAHSVADRSSAVRLVARALWPAARRAERVELSDEGIEAWSLGGQTRLMWGDVTDVRSARTLLGRQTLRIRGTSGRIDVAPILPRYEELERRVLERRAVAIAA